MLYRSQIIRSSLRPSSRAYTVPPLAGKSPKAKQADSALIYTTLGLVAAAGAYYYFRNTDEGQEFKDKDQMKRKSAELADAAKARVESIKQQGK